VVRLSPAIDEVNRTLLVETEVSNASHSLRPGPSRAPRSSHRRASRP
jgi:hypothetical protein